MDRQKITFRCPYCKSELKHIEKPTIHVLACHLAAKAQGKENARIDVALRPEGYR